MSHIISSELEVSEEENKRAEDEMRKYFQDSKVKSMSSPTEIEFSKLLDTCVVIMNKYVDSHSGLVGVYDQLQYFYDKFLQLGNANLDFLRTLAEKTDEGLVDVDQIEKLVDSQKEIMNDLSEIKKSLSAEYGVNLSQEGINDMKEQLKRVLKTVGNQSVQDFEKNFKSIQKAKGLPRNGIVKLQDKLYRYYLDSTDTFTITELN